MIYTDMPAELSATVDRLDNWGRWGRTTYRQHRARSIEGRYRPDRGDLDDERRVASTDVDIADASLVDRCIAPANGFPARWTKMLKAHFVDRFDKRATCRVMRIHPTTYGQELKMAVCCAKNMLTRAKV